MTATQSPFGRVLLVSVDLAISAAQQHEEVGFELKTTAHMLPSSLIMLGNVGEQLLHSHVGAQLLRLLQTASPGPGPCRAPSCWPALPGICCPALCYAARAAWQKL